MIAHGDRKAPCRAATCAPIRIIYQRRMVNALLSIVQRNCSRTFACVHSICGDIGAINDSIIAQHVNILRREASNGSVGSDRESIPHFGRPLHAPRVVSPPKSVSGILLWSIRSDLGGYTSKGGALVLNPCRDPVAKADLEPGEEVADNAKKDWKPTMTWHSPLLGSLSPPYAMLKNRDETETETACSTKCC